MKRVIVHIDQLVLRGFRAQDRHGIAAGLQQQLALILAEHEALAQWTAGGDAAQLQVAGVALTQGARPQHIGAQLAQGIAREIQK